MSGFISLTKDCALICVLKRGPEDLPNSKYGLAGLVIILMAVIWAIAETIQVQDSQLMTLETFDLFVTFGFVAIVLKQANKINRYLQSMIALIGSEALLNIALLLMLILIGVENGGSVTLVAFSTAVYFWRLVILCHIFRSMLSTDLPVALLITMTFEGVRIIMMLFFMPLLGGVS